MEKQITIYTKDYCFYCYRLKRFLNKKGLDYKEVEVSDKRELHREIIKKTGHRTVPIIFVGDKFIGGSEAFYEWHSKNS